MKLALVGSRDFQDWDKFQQSIHEALVTWDVHNVSTFDCVVSGGAKGADTLAERWAHEHGVRLVVFKPDWQGKGRAVGVLRNTDIVNQCTHLIAFPSSTGRGTQDSIRKARSANKVVVVFPIE